MNTFNLDASAAKVWFDETNLWVSLRDGRQLSVPLAYFPRLLHATSEQRSKFELSGGGPAYTGISWMKTSTSPAFCWAKAMLQISEKQRKLTQIAASLLAAA